MSPVGALVITPSICLLARALTGSSEFSVFYVPLFRAMSPVGALVIIKEDRERGSDFAACQLFIHIVSVTDIIFIAIIRVIVIVVVVVF
jgi:hypothetical protein